jgi:transcriptional regulator with XRE-family HTH domain
MGTKKWSEIKKLSKATNADSAEARAELEEEIRSYSLAELRRHLSITQEDLAAALHVNQPAVSKLERADDMSLSRLRNGVEALGGELEVGVRIDGCCSHSSCSNESRPDMPRTFHQILEQTDELTKKFEAYLAPRRRRFAGAPSTVTRPSAGYDV